MWLICFQPAGSDNFVPQLICQTEQEAKNWVQNAPFSVVGTYTYMFVPLAHPTGWFQRQERYDFPSVWPSIPEWCPPARKQWQYEIGDWPNYQPHVTC